MRAKAVLHPGAIAACLLSLLLSGGCAARSRIAAPAAAPAGVTWLIVVDDLHLDFRKTGYIRNLLRSVSTGLIGDEDSFAMRSTGPSAVAIGPSPDRAILDAAISKVSGGALGVAEITVPSRNLTDEIECRLDITFSAASGLLGDVPAPPGRRRAMLYISNGYETERGRVRASAFSRAARRAGVIVFAMNVRGATGSQAINNDVDVAFSPRVEASRRWSLRAIAEPTGGFAVLDEMDFAGAMSRIREKVTGSPVVRRR